VELEEGQEMKSSRPGKLQTTRPKLPKVSEEMKAWSTALAAEVADWPQVIAHSFFGFTALYRGDQIFAMLPRTRAMQSPNSLAFKLGSPPARLLPQLRQDPRVGPLGKEKSRWFTFELFTAADLRDALSLLGRACEEAGGKRKRG
jgi:hypothetical protein